MTAEAKRKCENCIYMYRLHNGKHPNTMYCGHTVRTNEYCSTQNWKNKCNKGQAMSDARPTGEWIDTGDMQEYWAEEYQCSLCGAKDHWHNYCPNCGAKMKGEAE